MLRAPAQPAQAPAQSRMVTHSPIFFGWFVILAGSLGLIMTSPGQTYGISVFIEHFITDLGVSRSLVSTYYAIGTLTGAVALPFIGRRIDQQGPRSVVVMVALLFGLACIYMGMVVGGLMLLFGFMLIRMLGQGSLALVSNYTINQWWLRRRGMAIGMAGVLMALFGMGLFPNLLNWLIGQLGWRATYVTMGLVLIFVMAPIGYLFYRSRPERYGLLPDGAASPGTHRGQNAAPEIIEEEWTLAEALRTPAFWIVASGLASVAMLATGLTFHMVSIFEDNQLSADAAAAVYVPIAIVSAAVNLGSGLLVDRMPVRFLLSGALFIQASALIMAQSLNSVPMALAYGAALGVLFGMIRTLSSVIWPTYYGRRYLGSITGVTTTISVAGSALGPLPMGVARDMLGSYNLALTILAVIPLTLSVVALFMKRPTKANK
jgi:sugar phosphate permease